MTYSSEVLADSPIGYWRLEEAAAASTVVDSSGNGRDGTAVNSPDFHHAAAVNFGVVGTGILWSDGPSSEPPRVDINDNAAWDVTDLTIEGWFRIPSVAGPGDSSVYSITPILLRGNPFDDYGLYVYAEDTTSNYIDLTMRLPFDEFGPGVGSFSGGDLGTTFDVWHHAVGVIDSVGLTIKIYLDGVEMYSQDNTFWPIAGFTITPSAHKLRLLAPRNDDGSDPEIPGYGDVDEVAIYNTALSGARILAHYNAAVGATNATPAVVAGVGSVPAATATGIQTATPAAVAGVLAVLQPSVSGGGAATASPAVAAGTGAVPAPTASGRASAAPARVIGVGAVPGPAIHLTATALPSVVAAIGRAPHPDAEGEGTGGGGGTVDGAHDFWSISIGS